MDSPLLFPVKLEGRRILVLDETRLPFKEEYICVDNLDKALGVLAQMKTRSLGQAFLFFYSCALWAPASSVDEISRKFKAARPTFDFLFLARMLNGQVKAGRTLQAAADNFVAMFDELRRKRAQALAGILPAPAKILTICNVNGELIYLYDAAVKAGKPAQFVVCETRPYLQGARLTYWELSKNNIPCRLICDNQAAGLMRRAEVNCVVTGADRATTGGDIINKAGTYALACLAKHFNMPFYPLTQYPRDIDIAGIEIEERPPQESFMFLEGDYADVDAVYPAFDITPRELVTQPMELSSFVGSGE